MATTTAAPTLTGAPRADRRPPRRRGSHLVLHIVLIIGSIIMIYPLVWMIGASLKPESDIFSGNTLNPFPVDFSWGNYVKGWVGSGDVTFGTFFLNSLLVCLGAIVGNLFSCSLAAYAFARMHFKFRGLWFAIMLGMLMLPFPITIVPQYIMFHALGWTNSILPLIVPKFFGVESFFVFLMIQFIRTIPKELEQAAQVDGANRFQIYTRVVLPLLTPALVTTTIFTFIWTWNDFFSQLIYLGKPERYTVAVGLQSFLDASGQSEWGAMFAMTTLSLIPVFLLFLFFQRRLVDGIATTGLK
ncbi:MAG TPA: carbohydrate ABC transporter permease [Gryllotalpicola sp.]